MGKLLILQLLYRGSYLFAGWLFVVYWNLLRRRRVILGIIFLCLFRLFIRARRLEPGSVRVQHHALSTSFDQKIVLISDLHLGVYKDDSYLRTVVDLINQIDGLDSVYIAGDLTYEPVVSQKLSDLLSPLEEIEVEVLAVLGNHDVEHPGPPLRNELVTALQDNGVRLLNNDLIRKNGFVLAGLGSYLNSEDDTDLLADGTDEVPLVVLTHNPDTTLQYTSGHRADITLVGHTHCGQIRLPYIYKRLIPTTGEFDCGLTQREHTLLYITPGLGEVLLPMRFHNPPTIDILTFEKASSE